LLFIDRKAKNVIKEGEFQAITNFLSNYVAPFKTEIMKFEVLKAMVEQTDIVVVNSDNPSLKPMTRNPQKTSKDLKLDTGRIQGDEEGHIVSPKDIRVSVKFDDTTEQQTLLKHDNLTQPAQTELTAMATVLPAVTFSAPTP
jgi:hypothetical protein